MAPGFVIRKNQYYDSVFLMSVNKRISQAKGVQQTAVLMGSPVNKQLLAGIGIQGAQIDAAQPNDLVVAVIAETPQIVDDVLGRLDEWLQAIEESAPESSLHTLEDGLIRKPNANLVVISVPGNYAAREAKKALEAGLNVFLFSDNVSIEDELKLKQYATRQKLLVMGPDCGTSLIGGVGIGFANVVRKGSIGAIGAAGTGLQEFTSQVHNAGFGISHAIGTGSHDLSDKIGGLTSLAAMDALESDPQTKIIAIISKPPGSNTLDKLIKRIKVCKKPVIGCFLGTHVEPEGLPANFQATCTIDEAVQLATMTADGKQVALLNPFTPQELEWIAKERKAWSSGQKYLRGLFAGGTFCYQSQQILENDNIAVYSNTPLNQKYKLANPDHSLGHTVVDMGDGYYTVGKPHPMIDGTMRKQRILVESRDSQLAVLLLDFILGYNASMDPVGDLLDALIEARHAVDQRGGALTVVASICGTESDPQDLTLQTTMLQEAGVFVFRSNAKAVSFCCELLKRG